MSKPDYYETLGVNRDADDKTLKDAFRKMAMKYHPDRNPDNKEAEAKFKEVGEAYEALRDPQKRAAYDQFGHAAFQNGGAEGQGNPFGGGFSGGFTSRSMSDIFEEMFGGMTGGEARGYNTRTRGADVRYDMKISLKDAFNGKTETIDIPASVTCQTCSGSGAKPGSAPVICRTCGGIGQVKALSGLFTIQTTCPNCQGRGEVINDPCNTCEGAGVTNQNKILPVNVPAGIEDGARIRLVGEGEAGIRGDSPGDLYIFVFIKPHPIFRRDGADIRCRVPISIVTATLGGEFEIIGIDSTKQKVKVPEGAQNGMELRLRGKGMPFLRKRGRGDMRIEIVVETPRNLNKKQKEMLKKFEEQTSEDNNPQSTNFLNKIKNLFE